ncbi:heme-binding protein [Rhodovastum atsumiense]|uniref:Heme-binding protein n=2 Tax=Rhodovastum atsumiense TaxID=504468 RepID=A0A5M6IU11_9PROT|nr:heme-binding protein [Rhodovastum atsumiense]
MRLAAMASGVLLAGCSVLGVRQGTEEPRYTVLALANGVEIRRYGPRIAAETVVAQDEMAARNTGFRRLARYIFGANRRQVKIEMTAPVAQGHGEAIAMTAPVAQDRRPDGAWVIRFFMPAKWTMETLPVPDDPAVLLVQVPEQTVAVLRFTGWRDAGTIAGRQSELLRRLEATTWRAEGKPVVWFYDPPWTIPFLRRNEVVVPVLPR